jgi:Family of unknown function (DUF5706)
MRQLDVIEAQLTRVLSFFPRVDTKAAGLFTINSAILTISALNVQAGDLKQWYITVPGVFMVLGLAASYFYLYRCNFPQLEGGQGSIIYFAEIEKRTESNFISEYEGASEDNYRKDLLGQIWRNSQILCQKYVAVAKAIRLTLATLLPFAVFLIMTAVEHTRMIVVKG